MYTSINRNLKYIVHLLVKIFEFALNIVFKFGFFALYFFVSKSYVLDFLEQFGSMFWLQETKVGEIAYIFRYEEVLFTDVPSAYFVYCISVRLVVTINTNSNYFVVCFAVFEYGIGIVNSTIDRELGYVIVCRFAF